MEQMIECPVCLDKFDKFQRLPLVLICGHTVCKLCTLDLVNRVSGEITCPLDRKPDSRKIQ